MAQVDIEFPSPGVTPSINALNQTRSWQKRRRLLAPWRDIVGWSWKALPRAEREEVVSKPCVVRLTLAFPTHRTRDPHNYISIVKAVVDELVILNVWPDDSAEWVTVAEPVLQVGGDCRLVIETR